MKKVAAVGCYFLNQDKVLAKKQVILVYLEKYLEKPVRLEYC